MDHDRCLRLTSIPFSHISKYIPSKDYKTIVLVKYSLNLTVYSIKFSKIGFCLTSLLDFAFC